MTRDPAIIIDGLCRRFGDVVAVEQLTLEVRAGEVFGFLGHNGAGKTTTVRLLNGVLAPDAGTARVLDRWVREGHWSAADARRVAAMVGRDNARRVYRL